MNDLRSEIRASFENEQAAHPPLPSMRQTIVDVATGQTAHAATRQWLALVAAILTAVLVVTGLVVSRLNHATSPSHVPPVGDYGPPPPGVALIYVDDPNHLDWMIGYDWSGTPRGTLKVAHHLDQFQRIVQSPDGSAFEVADRRDLHGGDGFADRFGAPTGSYYSRLGAFLPGLSLGTGARGLWADDDAHFCFLSFDLQTGLPTLATQVPGQTPQPVAALPEPGPWLVPTSFHVASCSFKHDRAILVRNLFSQTTALWVVRLSDGKILDIHGYSRDQYNSVVPSSDSMYVAENGHTLDGVRERPTQIRRVSDWAVVASWNLVPDVLSFSGDGSLVVLSNWTVASGVYVMDWRSQSVVWYSPGLRLVGLLAQAAGRGVAVAFAPAELVQLGPECGAPTPPLMCHPTAVGITIVHADGTAIQIRGRGTAW
jgi:hypothetical protein